MIEYIGAKAQAGRLAFLPGKRPRLVAVSYQAAHVWELGRPEPVATLSLSGEHPGSAAPLGSADGRWLVLLPGGRPTLYDLTSDAPPVVLGESAAVAARLVGRPERLCVVRLIRPEANAGLTYEVWPLPARDGAVDPRAVKTRVLPTPSEPWLKVDGPGWESYDLSEDGNRFVMYYREEVLHVWDIKCGAASRSTRLKGLPKGLVFSPDGSKLVIDVGTIYVHDGTTLDVLVKWTAKYSYAPGLAWSPDSRLLARTDDTRTVRLYDASTGREVSALGTKRGRLTSVAFAPDGLTFAAGAVDGTVRVWDVE
jgi:WD40 repeat protein